jgi:hypothetical protein
MGAPIQFLQDVPLAWTIGGGREVASLRHEGIRWMACKTDDTDHQPFPQRGALTNSLDLTAAEVQQAVAGTCATVYCYIIATVEQRDGRFIQHGTAPNFQGGVISLCTCKHLMRTFKETRDWEDTWIAGFTGRAPGRERNALVYLMRVAHAFDSHAAVWSSNEIPLRVKQAKAAHLHPLGDLFRPKEVPGNPFRPRNYMPPHRAHDHRSHSGWHGDIDYVGSGGRRAALLFGGSTNSFLWDEPMVYLSSKLYRGQRKMELTGLLDQLVAE